MPAPTVSWYDAINADPIQKWEIGTIDAGSTSTALTVLIWNNRGVKDTDLSTMTNCTITTKDKDGKDGGGDFELIDDTWIQVRCDSMGELTDGDFVSVGGPITKAIQAGGNTTFTPEGSSTAIVTSPNAKEILGVKNDSVEANSKGNFAKVTLRAKVPATATAGNVDFLTRVAYQYV